MIGLYVLIVNVSNGTREENCQFKSDFIYCGQIPVSRRVSNLHLTVIHKYDRYVLFISLTEHSNVVVITPVSDGWIPLFEYNIYAVQQDKQRFFLWLCFINHVC